MPNRGLSVTFTDLHYEIPVVAPRPAGLLLRAWAALWRRETVPSDVENQAASGPEADAEADAVAEMEAGGEGNVDGNSGGKGRKKTILRAVSGEVLPGEAMAIMSASGGGKTTLLTLLAGRTEHPASGGQVLFGGHPRTSRTRRSVGFCTQDDVFFPRLTCRQTLETTAAIVLPPDGDDGGASSRARAVDKAIDNMLLRKCEDTQVGEQGGLNRGVSGGERKRLNIANEMLGRPRVLLLDEPTSGLDSTTALACVRVLREYADQGNVVIATVHQPSAEVVSAFDKVMLLSEGEVVWTGPVGEMPAYFASMGYPIPAHFNPYDYVMSLLVNERYDVLPSSGSTSSGTAETESPRDFLVREWKRHSDAMRAQMETPGRTQDDSANVQTNALTRRASGLGRALSKRTSNVLGKDPDAGGEGPKYATSFLSQVVTLGRRSLIQKRGAIFDTVSLVNLAIITATSIFWVRLGTSEAFLDDRTGALFFFSAFWSFTGALIALHTCTVSICWCLCTEVNDQSKNTSICLTPAPPEKAVLNKDRAAGIYRLSAYYVGKTLVEFPLDVFYPFIFSCITYFVIGFNTSSVFHFLIYWLIISLVVLAASSVGLTASAIVMDAKWAQALTTGFLLASMLSGGYYSDTKNQPDAVRFLRYISAIRFGYVALVRNELSGRQFPCEDDPARHTVYSAGGSICPVSEEAALVGAQVDDSLSIAGCVSLMLVLILITRTMGYFALKYLHTRHKPAANF